MQTVKKKPTGRPRQYDLPEAKKRVPSKEVRRIKLDAKREKVVFPKTGELVETSEELCSFCKYFSSMSGGTFPVCDYYLVTGKMRGCKQGTCDKFEKFEGKRRNNFGRYSEI